MKARIAPRIELENRTRLEEVIPIKVPFTVFVDPADICNFQCRFCPTGNRRLIKTTKRKPGLMDFELYKKIINDISEFESPVKVLRLYKDGEPLLHPRFADMIRYAKERGCASEIDTTSNGSLLNPEKNLALIEGGLDRINISVEGVSRENYKKFSKYQIDFNRFVDNIRHLYEHKKNCLVVLKTCGDVLSEEERELFFKTFGDIADRIFIEHVAPCWPNFKMQDLTPNSEFGIYGQEIKEVEVCPYIFYSISVNSDGTVSLCFLDWARELIIGDIKNQSLKDIWNGEVLFNYRKMHLMKRRKDHPICAACGQLSHCLPDDIDPFAEILLKRLEASRLKYRRG